MKNNKEHRTDKGFLELGVTFAVLLSMVSLVAVAFKLNETRQSDATAATAAAAAAPVQHVKLVVKSDTEHAKKGPEGTWHDAFLPADFSVSAGATVEVTVYNYDDAPHSFNASGLGVNVTVPGGSETEPSEKTFTFHAPQHAGRYAWFCVMPCDPWAMNHDGFMKGYVTVV